MAGKVCLLSCYLSALHLTAARSSEANIIRNRLIPLNKISGFCNPCCHMQLVVAVRMSFDSSKSRRDINTAVI
jgi:hypothetical protein